MSSTFLTLVLLSLTPEYVATQAAPAQAAAVPFDSYYTADDCPTLFGTQAQHRENKATRKTRLESLHYGENERIFISYYGSWGAPTPLRFEQLPLRAVNAETSPSLEAVFELKASVPGCAKGLYRLKTDDTIAAGHILAIDRRFILVHYNKQLRIINIEADDHSKTQRSLFRRTGYLPNWSMVWIAPIRLTSLATGSVSNAGSSKPLGGRGSSRPPRHHIKR